MFLIEDIMPKQKPVTCADLLDGLARPRSVDSITNIVVTSSQEMGIRAEVINKFKDRESAKSHREFQLRSRLSNTCRALKKAA
jgi:hypothetical protein